MMGNHSQVKDKQGDHHDAFLRHEITAQVVTPNDRRAIEALLSALQSFTNLRDHHLSLRTVITFLTIATKEGRALNDYARDLEIHRAMISHVIRDLCDRARRGGPGLGLVEIREQKRGERLAILLTEKGHSVTQTMSAQQMLLALRPFSQMPQPVSIRAVIAFLIIAVNDEVEKPADVARYLKVDRGGASRTIHYLADRRPKGGPGRGLIRIADATSINQKQALYLTSRGRALLQKVLQPLRSRVDDEPTSTL
jgi:DNA-binding MarR family transcriptional regulator